MRRHLPEELDSKAFDDDNHQVVYDFVLEYLEHFLHATAVDSTTVTTTVVCSCCAFFCFSDESSHYSVAWYLHFPLSTNNKINYSSNKTSYKHDFAAARSCCNAPPLFNFGFGRLGLLCDIPNASSLLFFSFLKTRIVSIQIYMLEEVNKPKILPECPIYRGSRRAGRTYDKTSALVGAWRARDLFLSRMNRPAPLSAVTRHFAPSAGSQAHSIAWFQST